MHPAKPFPGSRTPVLEVSSNLDILLPNPYLRFAVPFVPSAQSHSGHRHPGTSVLLSLLLLLCFFALMPDRISVFLLICIVSVEYSSLRRLQARLSSIHSTSTLTAPHRRHLREPMSSLVKTKSLSLDAPIRSDQLFFLCQSDRSSISSLCLAKRLET